MGEKRGWMLVAMGLVVFSLMGCNLTQMIGETPPTGPNDQAFATQQAVMIQIVNATAESAAIQTQAAAPAAHNAPDEGEPAAATATATLVVPTNYPTFAPETNEAGPKGLPTATPEIAVATATPEIVATATPENTPTPAATLAIPVVTGQPLGPTATPYGRCLAGAYVSDVTVPDGTTFAPNAEFTKTWRVRNNGSCAWDAATELVFSGGESFKGPASVTLNAAVQPGQEVEVSVKLTAPAVDGKYRGDWLLKAPDGTRFGFGLRDAPLFVLITVKK